MLASVDFFPELYADCQLLDRQRFRNINWEEDDTHLFVFL